MRKNFICMLAMTALTLTPANSMAQQQWDFDAKYATTLPKAGTTAPDFKLKTPEGKNLRLSDYKGKYIVLDFWASWCPDCRKEIPDVQRMYTKFHPKGVEFIGVSMDTDVKAWKAALEKYNIVYPQGSELVKFHDTKIASLYGVNWIPSMVLIDPDGHVALSTTLSYKMERTLTELMDKKHPTTMKSISKTATLQGSKGKLAAIIQIPEEAEKQKVPVAVIMHGFGGNKDSKLLELIADTLGNRGIASIRFDFNGHGQSEGKFEDMTVPNEIEDAKCVYNYISTLPYADTTRIAFVGHSQGGVVTAMTAGELGQSKVKAVALLAPAAVLRDDAIRGNTMGATYNPLDPPEKVAMPRGLNLGANYILTAFKLPIYETAAGYNGAAVIVHGTGDRIVPYTYGERFHNLWKGSEWHLLDYFDHGFSQNQYRVAEIVGEFLSDKLK